ncbi:MAG: GNAT family N-acetyltransferase [Rhodothermaceae bacterium]
MNYRDISPSEISIIEELWNRNKEYHIQIEKVFKELYTSITFEKRMKAILEKENPLKITIAEEDDKIYGYCISQKEGDVGEVVSLHVLDGQRGKGVGKELTVQHIDWLKENNCKEIGLYVAAGNDKTIKFYEQLGLCSKLTYMQLKPEAIDE